MRANQAKPRRGGSVSAAILDRPRNEADCPVPPRPAGLGGFGSLVPRPRIRVKLRAAEMRTSHESCLGTGAFDSAKRLECVCLSTALRGT